MNYKDRFNKNEVNIDKFENKDFIFTGLVLNSLLSDNEILKLKNDFKEQCINGEKLTFWLYCLENTKVSYKAKQKIDRYKIKVEYLWKDYNIENEEIEFNIDYNYKDRYSIPQVGTFYFYKDSEKNNVKLMFSPEHDYITVGYIKDTYDCNNYSKDLDNIYEDIIEDDVVLLDKSFLVEHDVCCGMPVKLTLSKIG